MCGDPDGLAWSLARQSMPRYTLRQFDRMEAVLNEAVELARERRYRQQEINTQLQQFATLRSRHAAYLESLDAEGWQRTGAPQPAAL